MEMNEVRDIKSRGKQVDSGVWVVGYYVKCRGHHYILQQYNEEGYDDRWETRDWIEVTSESVGEFTGGSDKNGVERFEHDVVENERGERGVIIFIGGAFVSEYLPPHDWDVSEPYDGRLERQTVIGNIIDNTELLKVTDGK